jgi:hypothetical protein
MNVGFLLTDPPLRPQGLGVLPEAPTPVPGGACGDPEPGGDAAGPPPMTLRARPCPVISAKVAAPQQHIGDTACPHHERRGRTGTSRFLVRSLRRRAKPRDEAPAQSGPL